MSAPEEASPAMVEKIKALVAYHGHVSPAFAKAFYAIVDAPERFTNVFCSQCGRDFGPGEHGFSHCRNHAGKSSKA